MPTLASLPWYDLPADELALDRFWSQVRSLLATEIYRVVMPERLHRQRAVALLWQHPRLVLSQCCGPDLVRQHQLQPLGRPVFSALDCEPGYYFSHLVVRRGFVSTPKRAAINAPSSRSGCLALKEWLLDNGLSGLKLIESGAHVTSLKWLAESKVDIAAIDAHTWDRLGLDGFDIIGRSKISLTPPYVMHRLSPVSAEQMYEAVKKACTSQGTAIGIEGVLKACRKDYLQSRVCQVVHESDRLGAVGEVLVGNG